MTSSSQAQTVVGVLIMVVIFFGLMLLQAMMEKGDSRCGRGRSYMNPSCQEAAVHFRGITVR